MTVLMHIVEMVIATLVKEKTLQLVFRIALCPAQMNAQLLIPQDARMDNFRSV